MPKKNEKPTAGAEKNNEIKELRRLTAERMSALSDETRIGIVSFLLNGEKNVGEIAEAVGVPMVNASHHLTKLRTAGIIKDRKEGRFVIYSLNPEVVSKTGHKSGQQTALKMGVCSVIFES